MISAHICSKYPPPHSNCVVALPDKKCTVNINISYIYRARQKSIP